MSTTNEELISRFKIRLTEDKNKITLEADEKTARAIQVGLLTEAYLYHDAEMSFHDYPTVRVTITGKTKMSEEYIEKFLALSSVRSALLKSQ